MSAIAEVLAAMGHRVTGTDQRDSHKLVQLRSVGVDARAGHDAAAVGEAEVVAASTAVPAGHVELEEARRRGLPVLRRADLLAAVCATRRTVAVAGTHGKTTTAAMAAHVLAGAGLRPSWIVGADLVGAGSGARWDSGEWLVVEADESDGTFLALPAEVALVTSVEPDHLEHWGGFGPLQDAFCRFLAGATGWGLACADDPGAAGAGQNAGARTYGTAGAADFRLTGVEPRPSGTTFGLEHGGSLQGRVTVPLPGLHNARNGAAALAVALGLGVPFGIAAAALGGFPGVARRFQVRGERGGVTFVDDYAHLPGEVAAALAAAAGGGQGRIVCVFQPHRYSRTEALWRDFGACFAGADVLAVTGLYPAGEASRPGVTAKLVVDAVAEAPPGRRPGRLLWLPERSALVAWLRRELRPGDLCLTLGAGDVTTLADDLLADGGLADGGLADDRDSR
jgi:UDP-N-acetylmuramate--alanine ligase